jgi:hypothetical protein
METSAPARVLIVEHKAPLTAPLLDAVRERARRGACRFTLLVPNPAPGLHKVVDPQDQGAGPARQVLDDALPELQRAAEGMPVEGLIGDPDPVAAVEDAINLRGFDEIVVCTHSPRLSRWLRLDLPSKVAGMGLPVVTIDPARAEARHERPERRAA